MRVLDGAADRYKQLKPFAGRQPMLIAVLGYRYSGNMLHDKKWPSVVRDSSAINLSNVGVIHEGERLTLRLKACHDFASVHPDLDDLQRHFPPEWRVLFGQIDDPHATLSECVKDSVGTDLIWTFKRGRQR